jgi:hypothetical protein
MMHYAGKKSNCEKSSGNLCFFVSWSYMLQIEECQVKIQYKSHLIEFQHHIEEVQRFFLNQVNSPIPRKRNHFYLFLDCMF